MSQPAGSPPLKKPVRLNPFIFPSETVIRFILLNVALLGVTLYASLQVGIVLFQRSWQPAQVACLQQVPPPDASGAALDSAAQMQEFDVYLRAWRECTRPVVFAQGLWMLAGAAIVLGAAFLLYWNFPRRIIRRKRLTPITEEDAPEIIAELQHLAKQAGLSRAPRFVWNPLDTSISGQAFGRSGSYAVALTGGLATQYYTDLPAFRAVVLHELAHLHNKDVDISYFTIAVWQAFAVVCLIPFGLSLISTVIGNLLFAALLVVYTIPLVMLVFLTRNSVLRIREYYADLRVAVWQGASSAIDRVLASMPPVRRTPWVRASSFHPDPEQRRRTLSDPGALFKMGFWEALGAGLAASVAIPNLVELFNNLLGARPDLTNTVPALFFAPLAMGIVGLGAYRISFARLVRGQRPAGLFPLAGGLALGIMLGFTISFGTAISQLGDIQNDRSPLSAVFFITGLLLTTLVAYLLLRWIAACAEAWLELTLSRSALRLVSIFSLVVASGLFTVWMMLVTYPTGLGSDAGIFFQLILASLPLLGPLGLLSFFDPAVQYGLTIVVLGLLQCLWLLPLAAWLFRKAVKPGAGLQWALLSPLEAPPPGVNHKPLRPLTALTIGVAGGLGLIVLFAVIRLGLRLAVSEAVRSTDTFRLYLAIGQILLSGLVQAALGGITALLVGRQGAVHGLLTIFTSGIIGAVGFLVVNLLFGGSLAFDLVWNVFSASLPWGFFFGLPVVMIAAGLRGLIRR